MSELTETNSDREDPPIVVTENVPTTMSTNKNDHRKSYHRKRSLSVQASIIAINNLRKQSVAVTLSFWASFRGICFALLSSVCFSMISVLVKFTSDVDPSFIASIRFIEMGILASASLAGLPDETILGPKENRTWMVFLGMSGATGIYLLYLSFQLLPLANAMVLFLTVPTFTTVFARIFFKEPCGIFHVIALAVAFIGMFFTAKLDAFLGHEHGHDSTPKILGLFCGLGAALCQSAYALITRFLKHVHFAVILFTCSWVAGIEAFIITYFSDALHVPERGMSLLLVMSAGVFAYFGQVFFTKALSIEEASLVMMAQCSMDLCLAFLLQITVFQHIPDTCTVIGSIMVFCSVLLTSLRKYLVTLPEDHRLRYYLAFVLK